MSNPNQPSTNRRWSDKAMPDEVTPPKNISVEPLAGLQQHIQQGGGQQAIQRQHDKGRLTARQRIAQLIDPDTSLLEIGLLCAYGMYQGWGGAPAAGVITVIGTICGRPHMIVANDATVKAGAFFPATAKKVLRGQHIALQNRLPVIYLVDSAGIFLPLQEDVFPDDDDFGRIFRNNSILSAEGIGQIAAVMGNCAAGGSYLPVLCDKILMTDGSGLYLAGPALVKSAIGQEVSSEELGGAEMHAQVSGTIDYREKDDSACLARLRRLIAAGSSLVQRNNQRQQPQEPQQSPQQISQLLRSAADTSGGNMLAILSCIVDSGSLAISQRDAPTPADASTSIVCATARIDGFPLGIIANQQAKTTLQSTTQAAQFIQLCNEHQLPILFLLSRFGLFSEPNDNLPQTLSANQALLDVLATCRVPKITWYSDSSCGANDPGACGRAIDPHFIFAWPAEFVSRPPQQTSGDASSIIENLADHLQKQNQSEAAADLLALAQRAKAEGNDDLLDPSHPYYGPSVGWIDAIIDPADTRAALSTVLSNLPPC